MQKVIGSRDRAARPVKVPTWGWMSLALVLLILFAVLFDNGALLAPLAGESSYAQNYLHEFFHDGRHLLGVPGH